MRRLLIIGLILLFTGHVAWRTLLTRSSAIQLEQGGYELIYTMAWGFGMSQRFSLSRRGNLWPGPTSEWMEIWKRPYNSGLSVYYSSREGAYYIGSIYKMFRFDLVSGTLKASCDPADVPKHSENASASSLDDNRHPAARNFTRFIASEEQGTISTPPRDSIYYKDLKYIGRFGLLQTRGSFRGGDATFSPPDKSPEPLFSLDVHCG